MDFELIEKQRAIQEIRNTYCSECDGEDIQCRCCEYQFAMDIIENMEPEKDLMQTGNAKWVLVRQTETVFDGEIERHDIVKCSNCGVERTERTPFCPICGFMMNK